ncbi:thiol reductant ABC exporter subunit CydC [Acidocella sp.]|uniref:thiol reductant ABC exporter subunit CydC n=1 Tax=Acidocella sp. TaxID=50710 RepID=UPI002622ADE1|nr:thiol reductant ABC exporter subunit CydC [Acidocella sp.]
MRALIRLAGLFRPFRGWMLGGLALSSLTILANFWLMTLSGWFLAAAAITGLAGYAAQNAFNFFSPAAGVRFFATLRVGSRYAERLVTHEATFRLLARLRVWFYATLEPLAPAALQGFRSSDLLSRLVADIDTLNLFYLRVYVPVLSAIIATLIMTGFFALFSVQAALILLAGLVVTGALTPYLTGRAGRAAGRDVVRETAALRGEYVDAVLGMGELLTYGAAPALLERAARGNTRLLAAQAHLAKISGAGMAASGLTTNFALLAVTLAAGGKVAAGHLGTADLPLLALGTAAAFEAVAPLPAAFQYLGQILEAAQRIFAIADLPPAVPPLASPAPVLEHFALVLDDVSLRYAPGMAQALRGISLTIPEGGRTGITGPTGAGKSTLINLLLRFHEYQTGHASFGGHDLRTYDSAAMARYVTIISQRSHLFHTTIRDNLLLADGAATEAQMWQALEVAQLAGFVRAQPRGLDTMVGETGARLSGGQARRVALARAVLRPTPWLILDEPTEGLDATTEQDFLRDLAPLLEGRTVLCITHRAAPLALMQQVYALNEGRLVA